MAEIYTNGYVAMNAKRMHGLFDANKVTSMAERYPLGIPARTPQCRHTNYSQGCPN